MRKALAFLAFFALCLPAIARADVPFIQSTASLTAVGQSASLPLSGQSSCAAVITGVYTGTNTFEGSVDGSTFVSVNNVFTVTGTPNGSTTTTTGTFIFPVGSYAVVRVRMSAFTSGSAGVTLACGSALTPFSTAAVYGSGGAVDSSAYGSADGASVVNKALAAAAFQFGFNGSSWDRLMVCPNSVSISVNTAATSQLVAASGSTRVYVCSINFIAGGATNVTLEYGTGTNCGTGTTALTGAYPLAAQTGIAMAVGVGSILRTPASQALCIVNSAAIQVSGFISYVQY